MGYNKLLMMDHIVTVSNTSSFYHQINCICHHPSVKIIFVQAICALILLKTSALFKLFTYLLTYNISNIWANSWVGQVAACTGGVLGHR